MRCDHPGMFMSCPGWFVTLFIQTSFESSQNENNTNPSIHISNSDRNAAMFFPKTEWNRESSKIIHPWNLPCLQWIPQNNQPFAKTYHFAGLLGRYHQIMFPKQESEKPWNLSRFVLFRVLPAIQMPLPSAQLVHKHRLQHHNLEFSIKPILGGWFRHSIYIYIYIARNIDYILLYDKTYFLL